MDNLQACTRKQGAREYQWSQFPEAIQERFYAQYGKFNHGRSLHLAERDIQSASDTLSWSLQGTRLDPFLKEHREGFGEASINDLADMAKTPRRPATTTRSTILFTLLKPWSQ